MDKIEQIRKIIKSLGIIPEAEHYEIAKVIIQECIQLCQKCIDDGCVEAEEPMRKIKERFGVE